VSYSSQGDWLCVCAEILYGSLITVGLVATRPRPPAADAVAIGNADDDDTVLRRHPGFTADSIGYNAENGQSVHLYTMTGKRPLNMSK